MLEKIDSPEALKRLSVQELGDLAGEIRQKLIDTVLRQGGHLASNLGVVELTLAIHYVFDLPEDKLVFDVGHQSYVHKLLTGRQAGFERLREKGGVSGFPRPSESEYDAFVAGHASNALSAALGMARARDLMGGHNHVLALLGDGALTGGMCYEALNDAGQTHTRLIVILNDNEMSISRNVGALANHLTRMRQSNVYSGMKHGVKAALSHLPRGERAERAVHNVKSRLKSLLVEDRFFDALGCDYYGPIDGHNIARLIALLSRAKDADGPVILHVVTQKGRGYEQAEKQPDLYHGVSPNYFVEKHDEKALSNGKIAAEHLCALAEQDLRVVALTAGMPQGTGLSLFAERFPDRFFDVGIAEEHMVTLAAGMAAAGLLPYVGVYSTFLQRAFDQVMHDVAIEHLPVKLLIDRSGLVGADGVTHQGLYDISLLRQVPGMVIATPRDVRQLHRMIDLSHELDAPMAIRYAKDGADMGSALGVSERLRVGSWEEMLAGEDAVILACGRMVQCALNATIQLMAQGISCGVIDARFIKPMDEDMLRRAADTHRLVVTLEDGALAGGFGAGVLMKLAEWGLSTQVLCLGVPDRFIEYATVEEQLAECGLTPEGVCQSICARLRKKAAPLSGESSD